MKRCANDICGGATKDEEDHRHHQSLQSSGGSRLRHHSSSIPLFQKQVSMSLGLLKSIFIICSIVTKNNDITSSPMFASASTSASYRKHRTTRAAFCGHNTQRATPSLRSAELRNVRPHSTLPIQLGTNYPVSSSASALRLTDKKSTPDETIVLNGDITMENDERLSHETLERTGSFEVSASASTEADAIAIPSNNLSETKSTTTSAVAREGGKTFLAKITVLFSLVVLVVLKMSPSGSWRYYLAGGICASTSHAITTPIDVVKTRQQVDPTLQGKSMWKATLAIVKQGGPFALLAGLGPTALGYLLEGGVKFGIYEVSKPFTQRALSKIADFVSLPGLNSKVISLTLCGLIAGTAASLMLSPMEALRIRVVSDSEYAGKSSIDAMSLMVRREGLSSISKGLPAMLLKQVPYTVTKNCSFDVFTMWAYRILRGMGYALTANIKIAVPLMSAAAAAVLSCISSHPGDILLSLVNAHEGPKRTRDFAREILHGEDGARGFLVGIKPRFLHVILIVTVQLMIYDFAKRLVGIPATGL